MGRGERHQAVSGRGQSVLSLGENPHGSKLGRGIAPSQQGRPLPSRNPSLPRPRAAPLPSTRHLESEQLGGVPSGGKGRAGWGHPCCPRYITSSYSTRESTVAKMLSAADKANVQAIWSHVAGRSEPFGTEFLNRLFTVFPSTKTYFPEYNLTPGSSDIKAQGKKIAEALNRAVAHLDDMAGTLSALSDLHAEKLRVDPVNFEKLRECILVTLAAHHGGPIKPEVLRSLDKFLCAVNYLLTAKYR